MSGATEKGVTLKEGAKLIIENVLKATVQEDDERIKFVLQALQDVRKVALKEVAVVLGLAGVEGLKRMFLMNDIQE